MTLLNRMAVLDITETNDSFLTFNTRLIFDIIKDEYSYSNKGIIHIFNLTENSRSFLESESIIYNLKTGYQNTVLKSLFLSKRATGNSLKSMRKGPDVITSVELGDGEEALQATISMSYKGRVNSDEILRRCLQALRENGIPLGYQSEIESRFFNNGFTALGTIRDVLNHLAILCNFEWSIQDGEIFILNELDTRPSPIEINEMTGLKNTVVKSSSRAEFTSFINPDLQVGRQVNLTSAIAGRVVLRLTRIHHKGDSWGGHWSSYCEGILL